MNVLKLTALTASVAALSIGCASSGYARYDSDRNDRTGAYAQAETGSDMISDEAEGAARSTVSALSFTPETRVPGANVFPWYDWEIRTVDVYTFAVPDPDLNLGGSADYPSFSANMEPGSVFVEAAGGTGQTRAGRVIQHSPNPVR